MPDGAGEKPDDRESPQGVEVQPAWRDDPGEPDFVPAIGTGSVGLEGLDSGRLPKWFVVRFVEAQEALLVRLLNLTKMPHKRFTYLDKTPAGVVRKPLFVGYIFVQFDPLWDYWQQLLRMPPVLDLLGALRPGLFEELETRFEGIVRISMSPPPLDVAVGDHVKITSGSLLNVEGVVVEVTPKRRASVAIVLLGRMITVDVAPGNLKVVPCAAA